MEGIFSIKKTYSGGKIVYKIIDFTLFEIYFLCDIFLCTESQTCGTWPPCPIMSN